METLRKKSQLSEEEIDALVIAQADDDSAWSPPEIVRKKKPATVSLSTSLAKRAAFFARLHREQDVGRWLNRIIQERLDLEEAAFSGLKRELASRASE